MVSQVTQPWALFSDSLQCGVPSSKCCQNRQQKSEDIWMLYRKRFIASKQRLEWLINWWLAAVTGATEQKTRVLVVYLYFICTLGFLYSRTSVCRRQDIIWNHLSAFLGRVWFINKEITHSCPCSLFYRLETYVRNFFFSELKYSFHKDSVQSSINKTPDLFLIYDPRVPPGQT